jgi:ketopantoate hydroxymethyltransferase
MRQAFTAFKLDVETRAFPTEAHSVAMKAEEWETFLQEIA